MKNYYQIIGVKDSADDDQIRQAFLKKAKVLHPDVNHSPTATQDFQDLQEAYHILKNPNRRSRHDTELSYAATGDVPMDAVDMALAEYVEPKRKKAKKTKQPKQKRHRQANADYEAIPDGFDGGGPHLGGIL